MTYSLTEHLLACFIGKLVDAKLLNQVEIIRKFKTSTYFERHPESSGASHTNIALLLFIAQKLNTSAILYAWQRNTIIMLLEFTSLQQQNNILCILQSNYSLTPQLPQ
jgi:hypothetical protein